MKVYVIRHGLTKLNKEKKVNGQIDEPLLEEGIKQAENVIPLIPKSIKIIYSSPLKRAHQTAQIINSSLNLPLLSVMELAEIHMGNLAGYSWEEMESGLDLKDKHRSVQFDYQPYGGESVKTVKKRVLKILKHIRDQYKDGEVLIVTHGGIIRLLHFLEQNKVVYETEKNTDLLSFDLNKILNN